MTFDSSPATFYRDELDAALREQLFGIRDYRITSSTSRQATAMLVTLEGLKLTIVLNSQGYSVDLKRSDALQTPSPIRVYESVEGLLHSISPSYSMKTQTRLFEALQALT